MQTGLAIALLGIGIAGCRGEEPASGQAQTALEGIENCLDFAGNVHCSLGNAQLSRTADGALHIGPLGTSGGDGVAIHLPGASSFTADGQISPASVGLHARALSAGAVVSTTSVQRTSNGGYALTASFTGSGTDSTYNANLYQQGALVGVIRDVRGNVPIPLAYHNCHPQHPNYPNCFPVVRHTGFKNTRTAAALGACVWDYTGAQVKVTLPTGGSVIADRVELVENVDSSGGYPYLNFDRLDYLVAGGSMVIKSEVVE